VNPQSPPRGGGNLPGAARRMPGNRKLPLFLPLSIKKHQELVLVLLPLALGSPFGEPFHFRIDLIILRIFFVSEYIVELACQAAET
jgi:hypothetical protein